MVVELNHLSLRSGEDVRIGTYCPLQRYLYICNLARHLSPKDKCLIRQDLLLALNIVENL